MPPAQQQSQSSNLVLASLRGGMNDTDPPTALPEDQCVLMQNVETFTSTLGERRAGCISLNIQGSTLNTQTVINHLSEWYPTNVTSAPEWWAVAMTVGMSSVFSRHGIDNLWHDVTPDLTFDTTSAYAFQIQAQAITGLQPLYFFAYPTAADRLKVWDGTNLRVAGLAQPLHPSVADTGSGSYSTIRYFRVRYTAQDGGGRTLRRSEPSTSQAFTPSGSGSGAVITQPALLGERETHWEIEASEDNATFYRIATLAIATTTYTDSTAYATGYSANPLSEPIGTYLLISNVRFVGIDGDRLILASHFTDSTRQSSVYWTPVFNDPGVGNFERLPLAVNNSINLDNGDGGEITGITNSVNGVWYVFKWRRIYAMIRTNDITQAYQVVTLSTSQGAIAGSQFEGIDEYGQPCIYFLDPMVGPCRVGTSGIQLLSGLRTTWKRMNLQAGHPALGVYYPYKQQAKWWIAVDGSAVPNLGLVLQISNIKLTANAEVVRGGWSQIPVGDKMSTAQAVAALTGVVIQNGVNSLSPRPVIGLTSPDFIQVTDVGHTDNGQAYQGLILSRPYILADLLNRWGVMVGAVLTGASLSTSVKVTLIRDFGRESIPPGGYIISQVPVASEAQVITRLDNLALSNSTAIQIQFSDA